jgi:Fe2+ transport system protein FeoA
MSLMMSSLRRRPAGAINRQKIAIYRQRTSAAGISLFEMATTLSKLPPETRLDVLPPRQCAVVRRIETDGDDVQRLKALGICVGRRLEVVRSGDPLIVRVFGSRVGLSAALASRVWLEVCAPDHCALRETHAHE